MKSTQNITLSAVLLGATLLTAPMSEASGIAVDGAISPEEMEAMVAFSLRLRNGAAASIKELELVISDDIAGELGHLNGVAGFAPVAATFAAFRARLDTLVMHMYGTAGGAPAPTTLIGLDTAMGNLLAVLNDIKDVLPANDSADLATFVTDLGNLRTALVAIVGSATADLASASTDLRAKVDPNFIAGTSGALTALLGADNLRHMIDSSAADLAGNNLKALFDLLVGKVGAGSVDFINLEADLGTVRDALRGSIDGTQSATVDLNTLSALLDTVLTNLNTAKGGAVALDLVAFVTALDVLRTFGGVPVTVTELAAFYDPAVFASLNAKVGAGSADLAEVSADLGTKMDPNFVAGTSSTLYQLIGAADLRALIDVAGALPEDPATTNLKDIRDSLRGSIDGGQNPAVDLNTLSTLLDDLIGGDLRTLVDSVNTPAAATLAALFGSMNTKLGAGSADFNELNADLVALLGADNLRQMIDSSAADPAGGNLKALFDLLVGEVGAGSVDFINLEADLRTVRGATGLTTIVVGIGPGAVTTAVGDDLSEMIVNMKARITAATLMNGLVILETGGAGDAHEARGLSTAADAGVAEIFRWFSSYLT